MRYDFKAMLARGEAAERALDSFFAGRFDITNPSRQSEGIDRVFAPRNGGRSFTVEYKTDWTAVKTHNAFIETVSVDKAEIQGWAHTSKAEWLIYYIPEPESVAYAIKFARLRDQLGRWISGYPHRTVSNEKDGSRYNTIGVLVPLDEMEAVSKSVLDLSVIDGQVIR